MTGVKYTLEFVRNFLKQERNISLIDTEYHNGRTPIKCECNVCGYIWGAIFANIKHKQGCPKCGRIKIYDKHRKKQSDLLVLFLQKNIIPLNIEDYRNAKTPILCKCQKCNWEWETNYSRIILENKGCPGCKRKTLHNQQILSVDEVQTRLDKQNIFLNGIYFNATTPIQCKCKNCKFEWTYCNLNNLINNNVFCPNCSNISFLSEKICRFILENIFDAKFPKYKMLAYGIGGGKLELDGYNDKLKIAFEHNGPQHYSPKWYGKSNENLTKKFNIQCQNDKIKYNWCKSNGIILIIFRDLGKYTTETNFIKILKQQLITHNYLPPSKLETYIPDFKSIKEYIANQMLIK